MDGSGGGGRVWNGSGYVLRGQTKVGRREREAERERQWQHTVAGQKQDPSHRTRPSLAAQSACHVQRRTGQRYPLCRLCPWCIWLRCLYCAGGCAVSVQRLVRWVLGSGQTVVLAGHIGLGLVSPFGVAFSGPFGADWLLPGPKEAVSAVEMTPSGRQLQASLSTAAVPHTSQQSQDVRQASGMRYKHTACCFARPTLECKVPPKTRKTKTNKIWTGSDIPRLRPMLGR